MRRKAIIFGVSGQDGYFLSDFLIKKNYSIIGVARNKNKISNLHHLKKKIKIKIITKLDYNFIKKIIRINKPNEIYFLIGQSNSSISFNRPIETMHSNFNLVNYILEICRLYSPKTKFFNASSSEIYGDSKIKVDENSSKNPKNPYALSKYLSLLCTQFYRENFNIYACSGILFNHESQIRQKNNVIKKIANYLNMKKYYTGKLEIGNINIKRDWGWAPEYVKAMWLMLQQKKPNDFIIATGKTVSLKKVLEISFKIKNLKYKDYIHIKKLNFKKNEVKNIYSNPDKIFRKIKWKSNKKIDEILKILINKS